MFELFHTKLTHTWPQTYIFQAENTPRGVLVKLLGDYWGLGFEMELE